MFVLRTTGVGDGDVCKMSEYGTRNYLRDWRWGASHGFSQRRLTLHQGEMRNEVHKVRRSLRRYYIENTHHKKRNIKRVLAVLFILLPRLTAQSTR